MCVVYMFFVGEQHDDEESTEDGWDERRGSISSDGSLSRLVMDAALASELNDLAAQVKM